MKTWILLAIGVCFLLLALVVEGRCQAQDKRRAGYDASINQAQGNLKNIFGSSYKPESSRSEPVSRAPVFVTGGLGGIFLLAGLISFGSKKT